MFLKDKERGTLIKVVDIEALINPLVPAVVGRSQAGEEEQDPEEFLKENLLFPSDEALPHCWRDADYQATLN
ncbi:MAG: acetyltransferase [Cyanobacteria bacterium J069]|nr:MAG: acetyltransferase [Cyanobacteria bacterium J069]